MFGNTIDLPESEDAQAVFATIYDGDYWMSELMDRSIEMKLALMRLYHDLGAQSPTRTTTFRGASGETTQITRSGERAPRYGRIQADEVMVRVRNGRVERFTKG